MAARRPPKDPAPPRTPRRRRSPEASREAILAAADRLLVEHGPEGVGLAAVARAVGVTHGLVTHYFGTFAGLVREVFARRNRLAVAGLLEQIVAARETGDTAAIERTAIEYVSDEHRARLFLWLRLHDSGPRSPQGEGGTPLLRAMVDQVERALPELQARRGSPALERERLELLVLLTLAAGHGYAIGKQVWLRGLGREPGPAVDEAFRGLLAEAIGRLVQGG